jgi:hypothetical protein
MEFFTFIIIIISVSFLILIGAFIILRTFYMKRKRMFEKSKEADNTLKKINFPEKKEFMEK